VAIAPLPPRLIPQSRLGLGLAVHVVLARYDGHLFFYRLEQQFRERPQPGVSALSHDVLIEAQPLVSLAEERRRAVLLLTLHHILVCFFRREPACNTLARILLGQLDLLRP
jgi:hypothetical protein